MSAQANVQLVKNLFAAMGGGDLQAVRALTADDIEWVVPGEWALAGTHRGHAGLADFLRAAAHKVETAITQPLEFIAQGDRQLKSSRRQKNYGEFLKSEEKIATNVLASHLAFLEEQGGTDALAQSR